MTYLRINSPSVVHEIIDGEAVIVNLDNGLYFSTDGVGAAIWTLLAQAQSVEAINQWTADTYPDAGIDSDLEKFFDSLLTHELVSNSEEAPEQDETIEELTTTPPYGEPVLHTFSDMEELLLLDPVHDVGDQGWPST